MKPEMRLLGIAMAQRVLHAVGMDERGKIVWRKRLSRHDLMPLLAKRPAGRIGVEACGGAHDGARRVRDQGHAVKRMAPQFVKPSGKSHKHDRRDAEAIAAAVTRPPRRLVPIKDVDQPDIPALQRVRERLIGERTALINAGQGLRHASGIVMPQGVSQLRQAVVEQLESAKDTRTALRQERLWQWVEACAALEKPLAYAPEQRDTLATTHPAWQRLMTLPGLGPLTATALVAAVSEARACKHGRQCAAWLGLVPRPHAPGGKDRLLGISTRGDSSRRTLLV